MSLADPLILEAADVAVTYPNGHTALRDASFRLDGGTICALVGVNGSTPEHNRRALELIATGAVPVSDLITHRLPLDEVLEGIEIVARGDAIKVTIEP